MTATDTRRPRVGTRPGASRRVPTRPHPGPRSRPAQDTQTREDTMTTQTSTLPLDPERHLVAQPAAPVDPTGPVRLTDLPCRREDPDLWFAESPEGVEHAKSLCGPCPLRAECLAGALERAEPWGVWGGQLLQRGVVVARKRPRGRPRKDAVAA